MRRYLDDGCRWCGSQEWNDEATDVEHAKDCPAPLLLQLTQFNPIDCGWVVVAEAKELREAARELVGEG